MKCRDLCSLNKLIKKIQNKKMIHFHRRHRPIDRSSKGNELHPMTDVSVNGAYDTIRPDSVDSQPQTPKEAARGMYFSSGEVLRYLCGTSAFKNFPALVKKRCWIS